ncbi:hypothetical protein OAQ84_01085, partial [Bdellovibrionales bacterium]|nr:hypothetical protein [Bdellovibrionales bacterium]
RVTRQVFVIVVGIVCLGSYNNEANGQVDPSSQLLLQKNLSSVEEESLENSRYSRSSRTGQSLKKVERARTKPAKGAKVDLPKRTGSSEKSNSKGLGSVGSSPKTIKPKIIKNQQIIKTKPKPEPNPNELEIIGELMPNRGTKATQEYFKKIDRRDSRRNILEIEVSPLYFHAESDSNFGFRDYRSFGPGLGLGATVWFSPFLGLTTDIKSSLSGDIAGNSSGRNRLAADHLWVDIGFIFRRFSSYRIESPIFKYGLGFRDHSLKIPSDSTERVNLNSSGLVFSVERQGEKREGRRRLWGVEIMPKANHFESYASVDIQSGSGNETNLVGLWVGEEYEFTRKQKVFWRLKQTFEKNLFGGSANTVDPETGSAPSGVIVNQSQTFLQLGISFGN